jgi:hypothetical protein
MRMRPGMFLLSGLAGALALLGESTTMAQEEPSGGNSPSPPASEAPPPTAPASAPPTAAPGDAHPPPAPGYAYPTPAPDYQPPPASTSQPPGYHEHDGFYLRLQGGMGYMMTSESTGTLHGVSALGGMALGGAVASNLILYGELLDVVEANKSYGGGDGAMILMVGFGPGVAYYLEPINMYFSGTLIFSGLMASPLETKDSKTKGIDLTSDIGFGFSMQVGKEWWVSDNWGLGAAFQFHFASMKNKDVDARITALGFGALFTATYN